MVVILRIFDALGNAPGAPDEINKARPFAAERTEQGAVRKSRFRENSP
jgi:hypothetical protein